MPGELTTAIGAIGDPEGVAELGLEGMPGVDRVVPISRPYKVASSELAHDEPTIQIDGRIGGGGETFSLIAEARAETGLPIVTELLDSQHADATAGWSGRCRAPRRPREPTDCWSRSRPIRRPLSATALSSWRRRTSPRTPPTWPHTRR